MITDLAEAPSVAAAPGSRGAGQPRVHAPGTPGHHAPITPGQHALASALAQFDAAAEHLGLDEELRASFASRSASSRSTSP